MGIFGLFATPASSQTGNQVEAQTEVEKRRNRRGRINKNEFVSYYGRPVVKKAHWTWHIWLYFWLGGIAGGASAIASLASMFGQGRTNYPIIRAARYISLVGLLISPVLLILDLGRPERFLHMLRVVKFRSPLNLGTYILSVTGLMGGINTAGQAVKDGLIAENSLPGRLATWAANPLTEGLQGLFGLGLGSYTGVVLSATATPAWYQANRTMGPIFLCTSFSNGAAAISLVNDLLGEDDRETHSRLEAIERLASLSELGLIAYTTWRFTPQVCQAFLASSGGKLAALGVLQGQLVPLGLSLAGAGLDRNRFFRLLKALLVLSGGFLLRLGIIEGGKQSSQSADAYHSITQGYARPGQNEQS